VKCSSWRDSLSMTLWLVNPLELSTSHDSGCFSFFGMEDNLLTEILGISLSFSLSFSLYIRQGTSHLVCRSRLELVVGSLLPMLFISVLLPTDTITLFVSSFIYDLSLSPLHLSIPLRRRVACWKSLRFTPSLAKVMLSFYKRLLASCTLLV